MRRVWWVWFALVFLGAPAPQAFAYWVDVQASTDGGKTFSDTSPKIPSGTTVKIKWKSNLPTTVSSTYASCKVWSAPTPPSDVWTGLVGIKTTGGITQQTTYTAQCTVAGTVAAKDTIVITTKPLTVTTNQTQETYAQLVWNVEPLNATAFPGLDGPLLTTKITLTNVGEDPLTERLLMSTRLVSDGRVLDREERVEDLSLSPGGSATQFHETSCRELGGCELQFGAVISTDGKEVKAMPLAFGFEMIPVDISGEGTREALGRVRGWLRGNSAPHLMANALVTNSSTAGPAFPGHDRDCLSDTPCPPFSAPKGALVDLHAVAQGNYSIFKYWRGGTCEGRTTDICTVTAAPGLPPITAVFDVLDGNIDVDITGDGSGTVFGQGPLSDPIDCPPDCSSTLPQGTVLTLVAEPDGDADVDWNGCDSHTSTTCTIAITGSSQFIEVEFDAPESYKLADVNGDGRVTLFDARLALRHAGRLPNNNDGDVDDYFRGRSSHTLNEEEFDRADVNNSGKVTVTDANWIMRYARGCYENRRPCDPDDNPYDFELGTVGDGPYIEASPVWVSVERWSSDDHDGPNSSAIVWAAWEPAALPILDYCHLDCGRIYVSEEDSHNDYMAGIRLYSLAGDYFDGVYFADADGRIIPGNTDIHSECSNAPVYSGQSAVCAVDIDNTLDNEDEYGRVVFVRGQCAFGPGNCMTAGSLLTVSAPGPVERLAAPALPDLIIASAMYTPPLMKPLSIASFGAVVYNLNSEMSTPTTATLKIYQKVAGVWGATPLLTLPAKPVSGLERFAPAVVEWPEFWIVPNAGTYKFEFCVDPGNAVPESNDTAASNCRVLETRTETLTVQNLQKPLGTIVSDAETDEPDISCGATCSRPFSAFSQVTLRANPIATAAFDGWMSGPPQPVQFTVHSRQCPGTEPYTTALWATDRRDWSVMSCGGSGAYTTLKLPAPARIKQIQYLPPVIPTTVDHHRQILDILVRERFARYLYSQRANSILASLTSPDAASWASYFNLWSDDLAEVAQQLSEGKSIQPLTEHYGRKGRRIGTFYVGDPLWAGADVLVSGSKSAGIKVQLVDDSQWITDPKQQVPQSPVTLSFRYAKAADMAGTVFEASIDGSAWTLLRTIGGPPAGDYRWRTIDLAADAPPFQYLRMKNPSGKLVVSEVTISGESLPTPGGVCGPFRTQDCPLLLGEPTTVYGSFGKLGDVVPDGQVTAADALCILRAAVGLPTTCGMVSRADTNKDGEITAADALCALRNAVGLTALPCTPSARSLKVAHVGEGSVAVSNITGSTLAQTLTNANNLHGLFMVGPTALPTGAVNETVSMTFTPDARVKIVSVTGCTTLVGTTCTVTVDGAETVTVTTMVPQLTMVAPNGGETLTENTTYAVKWSQNYTPTSGVKLSLIRPSDKAVLGMIKGCGTAGAPTGVANQFKYVWTVGKNSAGTLMALTGGAKYSMRVTDCTTNLFDDSNNPFTYKK